MKSAGGKAIDFNYCTIQTTVTTRPFKYEK